MLGLMPSLLPDLDGGVAFSLVLCCEVPPSEMRWEDSLRAIVLRMDCFRGLGVTVDFRKRSLRSGGDIDKCGDCELLQPEPRIAWTEAKCSCVCVGVNVSNNARDTDESGLGVETT
jgi:hypothetical protein